MEPIAITWELGRDRYGRRVTLTKEGPDFTIKTDPADQRDDGEIIRSLSRDLILAAAEAVNGSR